MQMIAMGFYSEQDATRKGDARTRSRLRGDARDRAPANVPELPKREEPPHKSPAGIPSTMFAAPSCSSPKSNGVKNTELRKRVTSPSDHLLDEQKEKESSSDWRASSCSSLASAASHFLGESSASSDRDAAGSACAPLECETIKEELDAKHDSKENMCEENADKARLNWIATSSILFTCVLVYFCGLVVVARQSAFAELWITIGITLLSFKTLHTKEAVKRIHYPGLNRQLELIALELVFELMVVLTKIGSEPSWKIDACFLAFFCGQTFGFMREELRSKGKFAAFRSASLFAAICLQFCEVDDTRWQHPSGTFLVFGEEAHVVTRFHYGFWLLGVLYEDYQSILRHGSIQIVHLASYLVAFFSGEFWHARILTAVHSMVIDGTVFLVQGRPLSQSGFAALPAGVLETHLAMAPRLAALYNFGCGVCLVWRLSGQL